MGTGPALDATEVLVRVNQLSKTFRSRRTEVTALDGIDLSIARGEFVCVVGPSGCGKTTLLNIVGGLESPSSGSVEFSRLARRAAKPLISMVFQEQGVFPWMTVLDNAAFGLMARGVPRPEREAARARSAGTRRSESVRSRVPARALGGHAPARQCCASIRQRS